MSLNDWTLQDRAKEHIAWPAFLAWCKTKGIAHYSDTEIQWTFVNKWLWTAFVDGVHEGQRRGRFYEPQQ